MEPGQIQEENPLTREQLLEELKKVGFPKENPILENFIDFLGRDFQNLVQTVRSGFFGYAASSLGGGITTRSGGDTAWLAMANLVLARYNEKEIDKPE